MVPAVIVPDRTSVLQLLDRFRREGIHMAVMVDEYGTTEGIATLTDVLESIAGDLPERGELTEPLIVRRSDGSWLVAGTLPIDEFEDRFSLPGLQGRSEEHTSELQSLMRISYAVFCLKKKKYTHKTDKV